MSREFWSYCLSQLEQELPPQQFNTWIKTLHAEDGDGGESPALRLIAPNRFVQQWVRERYMRRIVELGAAFFGVEPACELALPAAGAARPAAALRPATVSAPREPGRWLGR